MIAWAIADFSVTYADQNQRDYEAMQAAVDFWRKYWKEEVQVRLVQKPR